MNVSPLTLIARELRNIVRRSDPQRLVLELTEHEPIGDYELYRDQALRLRGRGARIGRGTSSLGLKLSSYSAETSLAGSTLGSS